MKFFATVSGEVKFEEDKDFNKETNKRHMKNAIVDALLKDNLGQVRLDGVLDITLEDA